MLFSIFGPHNFVLGLLVFVFMCTFPTNSHASFMLGNTESVKSCCCYEAVQIPIVGLAFWHLKYGSELNGQFLPIGAQTVVSCSLLAVLVSSSHGICVLCI